MVVLKIYAGGREVSFILKIFDACLFDASFGFFVHSISFGPRARYFFNCLQLERDGERKSGIISCLKRLGQIYKDTEDFEAAIEVYEESVGICIGTSSDGANHAEVANIFGLTNN